MLSMESIARRIAMGVFSPVAGYYGASSAMYLCGGIGFVGIVLLALFARHAHLHGREGRECAAPVCSRVPAESD